VTSDVRKLYQNTELLFLLLTGDAARNIVVSGNRVCVSTERASIYCRYPSGRMKRARRPAVVESEGSGDGEDSEDSDYSESLTDKLKRKKAGVAKPIKVKAEKKKSLEMDGSSPKKLKVEQKVVTETKKKAVKEKVVKEKAVKEKAVKEKVVKEKAVKEIKVKPVKEAKVKGAKAAEFESNASVARPEGGSGGHPWTVAGLVAAELGLERAVAEATCGLLEAGNSLPFIARYRREATGGLGPDALRGVMDLRDGLLEVKEKCRKVVAAVEKVGNGP
jgi:hypothetical protein